MSLFGSSGQRKYLDAAERLRFLDAVERQSSIERLFCLTMLWTGCRISEALAFRPAQIGTECINIVSLKKRGKHHVRQVPVPPEFVQDLLNAEALPFPFGRTKAWQIVRSVMREANIAGLQAMPRGLRHTFGVHAIQTGVPLHLVQRWLGHSQLTTTAIYLNVVGDEEQKIATQMWSTLVQPCRS